MKKISYTNTLNKPQQLDRWVDGERRNTRLYQTYSPYLVSGFKYLTVLMSELTENQLLDYKKWYKETPEVGFSPNRNKAVIEESIRKAEAMRLRKGKDYIEQIRERSDAVVSYLKRVSMGMEKSVEAYFGRSELARLRGEKIVQEMQGRSRRLFAED